MDFVAGDVVVGVVVGVVVEHPEDNDEELPSSLIDKGLDFKESGRQQALTSFERYLSLCFGQTKTDALFSL